MGFQRINTLRPVKPIALVIQRATAGAAVPMVENGYLWIGQVARCIWAHGVLDPELLSRKVDTVITPVVDLGFAGWIVHHGCHGDACVDQAISCNRGGQHHRR